MIIYPYAWLNAEYMSLLSRVPYTGLSTVAGAASASTGTLSLFSSSSTAPEAKREREAKRRAKVITRIFLAISIDFLLIVLLSRILYPRFEKRGNNSFSL